MSRRPPSSPEDRALWRHVTRGIRPLRSKPESGTPDIVPADIVPAETVESALPPEPKPKRRRETAMDKVLALKGVTPETSPRTAPTPRLSTGTTPGVDWRQSERVRKGRAPIEARIDLHGMGRDQAHTALIDFIGNAQSAGRRMVLVITGKGRFSQREDDPWRERHAPRRGLLQSLVPRWLNDAPIRERIIGFHAAQPRHGGDGAIYVMLKRPGR